MGGRKGWGGPCSLWGKEGVGHVHYEGKEGVRWAMFTMGGRNRWGWPCSLWGKKVVGWVMLSMGVRKGWGELCSLWGEGRGGVIYFHYGG